MPKPTVQRVNKEIPKYVLQAQERIVDVPCTLTVERPVEVPMVQVAEVITQVPKPEYQYIDKQIPKFMTETREQIVEVPQVLYEERLVEVPQIQVAEVIRQVPKHNVQQVQKGIPKVSTQVVEKVVQIPTSLISETAVEVPQIQVIEVLKQTASNTSQQRIVQTGVQWQQAVPREMVVDRTEAARDAGIYTADVVAVREGVPTQSTVVERVNPILTTQEIVVDQRAAMGYGTREVFAMSNPMVTQEVVMEETIGAPRSRVATQELYFGGTGVVNARQAPSSMAAAGIDTTGDGRANLVYVGADRNMDGIPDALEQQVPLGASVPVVTGPMF